MSLSAYSSTDKAYIDLSTICPLIYLSYDILQRNSKRNPDKSGGPESILTLREDSMPHRRRRPMSAWAPQN